MKTKIYSIITTFFFVCLGLKAANIVTMNKPEIILASSKSDNENISIEKVELTDTATILSIKYTKDPGSSLYIGKHIRLIGQDEKSYELRSAEGIEIAKTTTVPKSGSLEYRLFFEPMPKNTHYFDFLQKFPDTYNIFGIHDSSYKMSFPAISSYDTKSEAIISTEEFFKSGIGKHQGFNLLYQGLTFLKLQQRNKSFNFFSQFIKVIFYRFSNKDLIIGSQGQTFFLQ